MILSGHSLGVNVARAVAGYLERMGVDVFAILALDPRTGPDLSPSGLPLAVTSSLARCIRLEALQLSCHAPYVPFMTMPQRMLCYNHEVWRNATVAIESMKMLSSTTHNTLANTHFWDIALVVKEVIQPV